MLTYKLIWAFGNESITCESLEKAESLLLQKFPEAATATIENGRLYFMGNRRKYVVYGETVQIDMDDNQFLGD